jgi:lipoprotein-anchoring transpeptidase ErfK/SrfK
MRRFKLKQMGVAVVTAVLMARAAVAQQSAADRRLVVSIPDHKLAVVENGSVVKVYGIATGAPATPSPAGTFRIVNRLVDPTYYGGGKVIGPGAANPLGNRWIGLDQKSYGIHGTNQPSSVGRSASHGCMRMRRRDLEELFARVRVGDTVEIHGERDEVVASIFGISGGGAGTTTVAVAQSNTAERTGGLN